MCTVTFIPVKDTYFITSNRDEKHIRGQALPPEKYVENGTGIVYPKDADAGGTWIAMNDKGVAAVLLNGAFEKHESRPPYRVSRGVIFLEILRANMPAIFFMDMDLSGIEPFTMIIFDNYLCECRWTGTTMHCRQLEKDQSYIWSSATLYNETVVKKREQWFKTFFENNPSPTQEDILNFHRFTGDGDKKNDLYMNRDDLLSTVSITGIALRSGQYTIKYLDIKDSSIHEKVLESIPVEQP